MKRNYHWLFVALAALLVLVRYMPAVYLSALDSDNIQIPLLFHNVIEQGHAARDWVWGGHSDIFPDITLVFLLEFILRNGLLSLQVASGVILGAYVVVLVVLYRQNGGRNAAVFTAMLLLFFVLLLINFGVHDGLRFISISSMVVPMHTSIAIVALGCLALCGRAASGGYSRAFWWLPVLCFITALSNDLFLVIFTAPILVALVVTRFFYPGKLRMFLPLVCGILLASAVGHLLAPHLSPFQIDADPFTHYHGALAAGAWRQFRMLCSPSNGGTFIIFAALDVLFLLFAAVFLGLQCLKPAAERIPMLLFLLLAFCSYVICCNWGAVILTGDFSGILAARYTRLAMLLPVFLLLAYLNHIIPWSKAAGRLAVSVLSLAVCACILFLTPRPDNFYTQTQQLVPIIRAIMDKEHIEAGFADYWYANPIAFFSRETLPVRAVSNDGSLFHWVNTSEWYTGDGAANPPPKFRLILMANLDPDKVRQRYGAPDQIIPTPIGMNIWIYSPEKSITWSPVFGTLYNGPANEYSTEGDLLPSLTGQREGHSRVVRAGRDGATFLFYGPYPYLAPMAGHYRITIFHTWLAAPDPGKLPLYDVVYSKGASSRTLDSGPIPYLDNAPHEFTRDIEIPDNERGLLQVRAQYSGSGSLRIDSLRIVYLGK